MIFGRLYTYRYNRNKRSVRAQGAYIGIYGTLKTGGYKCAAPRYTKDGRRNGLRR